MTRARLVVALSCALLAVAACTDQTTDEPTATPPPDAAPQIADEAAELVNIARDVRDLPRLETDPELAELATSYSCRMANEDFFSHTDPEGAAIDDRMQDASIPYMKVGENLARIENAENPAQTAVEGWLDSPTHAANMLRPEFTHTGMGVCGSNDTYYFTQVFTQPAE